MTPLGFKCHYMTACDAYTKYSASHRVTVLDIKKLIFDLITDIRNQEHIHPPALHPVQCLVKKYLRERRLCCLFHSVWHVAGGYIDT